MTMQTINILEVAGIAALLFLNLKNKQTMSTIASDVQAIVAAFTSIAADQSKIAADQASIATNLTALQAEVSDPATLALLDPIVAQAQAVATASAANASAADALVTSSTPAAATPPSTPASGS